MPSGVITAVQQDDRNKRRYHIYINDEKAFDVHEEVLVKYRLWKGTEVDESFCHEVLQAEELNKAYLLALRYLGIRPRSAAQVERYLTSKGHVPETVSEVVRRCEQQGYLDDERFARQWVQERLRLKGKSSFVLRRELLQKGIPAAIADQAMAQITRDDELDAARKLVAKKTRNGTRQLDADGERKMMLLLMRHGFSSAVVQQMRKEWREKGQQE